MGFSSKLTEEEEFLKKKYVILRKSKKKFQQLRMKRKQKDKDDAENGPCKAKQKKGLIKSTSDGIVPLLGNKSTGLTNVTTANAAKNTEAAKMLIKSGVIQLKPENRTTFKRSVKLAKKKKDQDDSGVKLVFQPFSPGGNASSDQLSSKKETNSKESFPEKLPYKIFPSHRENQNRFKKGKKFERHPPKKGNTIYVHGCDLSDDLLQENFEQFGLIVNINVEQNKKSGFVTYNNLDAADNAIAKMDNAMVSGTRLKVSLARRQPMIDSAVTASAWSGLATGQGEKGFNFKDTRSLKVYDDDTFSDRDVEPEVGKSSNPMAFKSIDTVDDISSQ